MLKNYGKSALKNHSYENNENIPRNEQTLQLCNKNVGADFREESRSLQDDEEYLNKIQEEETNSHYDLQDSEIEQISFGEPLIPQYISIDFTPIPGVDDKTSLQEKCSELWKFVNEHSDFQNFTAKMEDPSLLKESNSNTPTTSSRNSLDSIRSAFQALKGVDNIAQVAFATNQRCSYRDHWDNYVSYEEHNVEKRRVKLKKTSNYYGQIRQSALGLKSTKVRQSSPKLNSRMSLMKDASSVRSQGSNDVEELCREMEQWDILHSK